ncbi:hypothetical protein LEP1GSC008_3930 [Leptospira kirschneri serovar Bulgarica str. Nikolaevo]|uniref:Uncharacterized protein n=1 Tax=Leptospira kirschneri serovar Bulgarica str. Nikolaevo TaxID=1240687 RepID=M6F7M2_9LEPT|nr:hypothetical protein LEP1GSC008_3930 [Leptospira kirschneri serovar Bulgarica str. Nikolaevo]
MPSLNASYRKIRKTQRIPFLRIGIQEVNTKLYKNVGTTAFY